MQICLKDRQKNDHEIAANFGPRTLECLENGYQIKSHIRVAFVNGTDLK